MTDDNMIENKEVSWKVLDIEIHGTLTYPSMGESLPGVVMVAGSGPTDRNWCSPLLQGTNGSGKLLAEELAHNGYITLRYDKMASGPHVMENLPRFQGKVSMGTHADEVAGAFASLASQENVDRDRIFALTNSEGSIHAVNYQLRRTEPHFTGFVLTGAPGRSVGEVGREQLAAQLNPVPGGEIFLEQYDAAIAQFLKSEPMTLDTSLPEGIKNLLMSLENPANLPFSRELWNYSLSDRVYEVSDPVLVLIGKKDIQVSWARDGKKLEAALNDNPDTEFFYPENANHVLKHEDLPLGEITAEQVAMNYNSQNAELDREATLKIISWLKQHS